ncbi:hypothetical protein EHS25_000630 [Saitozyma podzolica]|uniref:Major facilitator superfamily (MFS) profile domain-containing protein n=1 Tax=Saitozyma podzolica TaxID=1890683 RepID=A0A427YWM1_9TREE|nr:hypothetical protein EHS25_000630 [Saitozyma podzolica]
MSTLKPQTELDSKSLELQHLDLNDSAHDAVKGEMAAEHEHIQKELTLWQNLKLYRKCVFWAAVMSASLIMEGYDKALIGNFWAQPAFSQRYGVYVPSTNSYTVTAPWQVAIGQAATIGSFFGLILGGWQVDRFGYRNVMLVNMVCMLPSVVLVTFAPNQVALLLGQMLCGIPWGVFAALAPAYSSELCPIGLRGYLTTYVNLCWVIGQFIAAGVVLGTTSMTGEWAYRLPFCLQLLWPLILIPLYWFCPESPWWLVRKGRLDDAEAVVRRVSDVSLANEAAGAVAAMVRTNKIELEANQGHNPRWRDCFKGIDLRRTEISAISWATQVMSGGSYTIGFCTYFFRQAGLASTDAFKMGLGVTACAFVGTLLSWLLIHHCARRTIFVGGVGTLAVIHFIIGGLAIVSATGNLGAKWAQSTLTLIWVLTYDFTIGPLAYCIVGESSSTRLRAKTVAISRNVYYIAVIFSNVISPYMLNPTQWNLQGKTNFVWGPIAALCAVWGYFRLPEMKNRSFYELDVLFENKVGARHFKKTVVESQADGHATIRRE